MLVLSRKLKEEILIGENIKITVLKVKGNTIRLGIEAPRDVHVLRGEIPKKSEVIGEDQIQPEIEEDFTIVFTNSDEEQSSKVDLIPFEKNADSAPSAKTSSGKTENRTEGQPKSRFESFQFQNKPTMVQRHSRLKEIVNQMTSK